MGSRVACIVAVVASALLVAAGGAYAEPPSPRSVSGLVDTYAHASESALLGGEAQAGADGFWLRSGPYALRIEAAMQTRFESWRWASGSSGTGGLPATGSGGDLSGFSVPRAALTLSGCASCDLRYHLGLELGHEGPSNPLQANNLGTLQDSGAFASLREAWIGWRPCRRLEVRMGSIQTPGPRQLMVSPYRQQFVDVALASAYMGSQMPGYTDRNRDFGLAFQGTFGAEDRFRYLLTVTNGDGSDGVRNVLDHRTSDNLAYGLRLDWAPLRRVGFTEGASEQRSGGWYTELGGWVFYYEDRADRPHTQIADSIRYGLDLAVGYGGFTLTGGVSVASTELAADTDDVNAIAALVQVGYLFPGTPWEIAARFSSYDVDNSNPAFGALTGSQNPLADGAVQEWGLAVNYYVNGHANKLTLDVAFVDGSDGTSQLLFDTYAGYAGTQGQAGTGDGRFGTLLRLQWQLTL